MFFPFVLDCGRVFMLCVQVKSTFVRLSSLCRSNNCRDGNGNLIKIYTDRCFTAKSPCEVKCDGSVPDNFTSELESIPRYS